MVERIRVEEDIRPFMALLTSDLTLTPSLSGNFSSILRKYRLKESAEQLLSKGTVTLQQISK